MKIFHHTARFVALLCIASMLCFCGCQAKEATPIPDVEDVTPTTVATTEAEQQKDETDDDMNDIVDRLLMKVDDSNKMGVAVDPAAVSEENIFSAAYWSLNISYRSIADAQPSTFGPFALLNASTWDNGLVKPADPEAVDSTGAYTGDMTPSVVKEDYVKFTVWFRSGEADKTVSVRSNDFFILKGDNQALLPALTLLVDNGTDDVTIFNTDTLAQGGDICVCSQKIGDYYVGSADFYIYIEGTHPATINQNANVSFELGQLSFLFAD